MPKNNWFVWFRYLSATTYYKDCKDNVTNYKFSDFGEKYLSDHFDNFATLFIVKYKFNQLNS